MLPCPRKKDLPAPPVQKWKRVLKVSLSRINRSPQSLTALGGFLKKSFLYNLLYVPPSLRKSGRRTGH